MYAPPVIYYCFPEGKNKVLTMSYDDGTVEDRRLVNLFNTYNIKGTFHLNSGKLHCDEKIHAEEIQSLYKGHEVAAHTTMHPNLIRMPSAHAVAQVLSDRMTLEDIVGYPVRGFSYPYGTYDADVKNILAATGIAYARTVKGTKQFKMPTDFLEWHPTCHHRDNVIDIAREFLTIDKTKQLYLFYVWGHSYEFDRNNNWEVIENLCKEVAHKDDIWYATNIEIFDYMNALKQLRTSVRGDIIENPSNLDLWVSIDEKVIKIEKGTTYRRG